MLLRDLTKVYISEYEEIEDHGEIDKVWKYKGRKSITKELDNMQVQDVDGSQTNELDNPKKGIAWLNLQNDISELDRKSTGEVDYSIYKARATRDYDIKKGDGISFEDISNLEKINPEYRVLDKNKIGNTFVYRLEKMQ